jgi:hypothetical protein
VSKNTKTPETVTSQRGRLSFVTETRTKRGAWLSRNYFDVAPQSYSEGMLTGKRLALELMLDMKANPADYTTPYELRSILADVLNTPTRQGAADGFMAVVIAYFTFGVTHAEVEKHMSELIAQQAQSNETMAAYYAKENAEVNARRIATRRANKALRAVEGAA